MHHVESRFNDEVKHNERSVCGGRQGANRARQTVNILLDAYNARTQLHITHSGGFGHALLSLNNFCWCVAVSLIEF